MCRSMMLVGALAIIGCKGEPEPMVVDDDPHALEPPAVAPDWTVEPRDLRETWLGYPLAGTHTYEVRIRLETNEAILLEDESFEEQRTYSTDLGQNVATLRIEGDRFRFPLDAWIGTSEDGWTRHWDPVSQDWRSVWPLLPEVGDYWEGPVLWFRRDSFAFSQFDGPHEIMGVDVEAPDGTTGTVHVRSTFEDKGWSGEFNVWYKRGPVVEERVIIRQNRDVERARSVRISTR